ncbi:MAG: chemotaxis protein CheW [Burkholderiaceae bacterium]|nr:chemotaxis protein CheW [Burkholderiaceae bacterium]
MSAFTTDLPASEQKPHLREFQERLTERLRQAESAPRTARLGMAIGEQRWLVELSEAGEISPVPSTIAAVPLTHDWLVGLVNLRGTLHAMCDLQRFAAGEATPLTKESRLLALSAASGIGAAILVTRMLGLHDTRDWFVVPADEAASTQRPAWIGRSLCDGNGHEWIELSLARLACDPRFLAANR